jgi:hypothetical protein
MAGRIGGLAPEERPGILRRIWDALFAGAIPDGPAKPDPLLSDLENLTVAEREARYKVAEGQARRGRGDGWMG